jgi:uncharacterized protein YfeS
MLTLVKQYLLTHYNVFVYTEENNIELINLEELNNLTNIIEIKEYPKQIIECMENINYIKKIEIFNKDNELLLSSISGII